MTLRPRSRGSIDDLRHHTVGADDHGTGCGAYQVLSRQRLPSASSRTTIGLWMSGPKVWT